MKKLLLLLMLCGGMLTANAQREAGALTLKPMVGMTIANITDGDLDAKIGLAAGAELEYQVSDKFSITGGAVYSMQGAKGDNDAKVNLEYINIPILANYYVAKGLAIKAGIQPGFNVKAEQEYTLANVNVEADLDANTVDFSIPVGISYEISDFVIDARYQWGLTKIADGADSKNSVFMISVGYKFDL